jgi:hypothetical protein
MENGNNHTHSTAWLGRVKQIRGVKFLTKSMGGVETQLALLPWLDGPSLLDWRGPERMVEEGDRG